jgi:hypothetical protein
MQGHNLGRRPRCSADAHSDVQVAARVAGQPRRIRQGGLSGGWPPWPVRVMILLSIDGAAVPAASAPLTDPRKQRSLASGLTPVIDPACTADVLLVYPRSHPARARHAGMRDSERCAEPSAPAVTPSAICTRLSPGGPATAHEHPPGRPEPRLPQPLPLRVSAAETASCGSACGGCRRLDLAQAWPTDHSRRSAEPLPLHAKTGDAIQRHRL